MKFTSATLLTMALLASSTTIGSSTESTQNLRSVSMASEVVASVVHHDDATNLLGRVPPRILKKKAKGTGAKTPKAPKSTKKPKAPKSEKVPKSAKGMVASASPTATPSQESSPPTEDPCADIITPKAALLALKGGFTNGGTVLSDWAAGTEPCDGWSGIICSDGEVTSINLYSKSLEGTISPLIGCPTTTLVSSLTVLALGTNQLTGTIPTELGFLTSLEQLYFVRNGLIGSMPSEICNLRDDANGAISVLFADYCGSSPEVECDDTCCNNFCE